MGWSTREIAELAGVSVRTVRHYHDVDLLAEPDRGTNGYKHYDVTHLVRLLQIKRLTDLGFSLARIAEMGNSTHHEQALRALDAELAATIDRLQRARTEVALILRTSSPLDLPPELSTAAATANLRDADRSLVLVMGNVLGPEALESYARVLHTPDAVPAAAEFDVLPADADEATRSDLARRMLPQIADLYVNHPELLGPGTPATSERAARTFIGAVNDLYNTAQVDVLRRIGDAFAAGRSTAPTPEKGPHTP